jgi:hypothetical protein
MGRQDNGGSEPCDLGDGKVVAHTEKALRVELASGDTFWLPRSVLHDDSELYDEGEHKEGKLVVKAWWADKEGLS